MEKMRMWICDKRDPKVDTCSEEKIVTHIGINIFNNGSLHIFWVREKSVTDRVKVEITTDMKFAFFLWMRKRFMSADIEPHAEKLISFLAICQVIRRLVGLIPIFCGFKINAWVLLFPKPFAYNAWVIHANCNQREVMYESWKQG